MIKGNEDINKRVIWIPRLAVHPNIGGGDTRSPRLARSRRNEEDVEKVTFTVAPCKETNYGCAEIEGGLCKQHIGSVCPSMAELKVKTESRYFFTFHFQTWYRSISMYSPAPSDVCSLLETGPHFHKFGFLTFIRCLPSFPCQTQ